MVKNRRGGKGPAIVFSDADLIAAANALAFSLLLCSGQACFATTRIYVEKCVKTKFLETYKGALNHLASNPGDAKEEKTNHGPQIDEIQFRQISRYLEIGKDEGNIYTGGKPIHSKVNSISQNGVQTL